MKSYQAIRDRILLDMAPRTSVSEGGIQIPESAQTAHREGTAVSVGPDVKDVSEGDTVLVRELAGTRCEVRGKDYLIVQERDILARMED